MSDQDPTPISHPVQRAPKRELFAWAMYDFANSSYTTVVLTTLYNAYFVSMVATSADSTFGRGSATLFWTLAIAISNGLILVSGPILGAMADHYAWKKRFLTLTTAGCVLFTAGLAMTGPGDLWLAFTLLILSNLMFSSGEIFIAAFLPEISPQQDMGRISGYGWSLGYFGGMLVLLLCLGYVEWARQQGHTADQFIPVTMLITASCFALAALPTLLILQERSIRKQGAHYIRHAWQRLAQTLAQARHRPDLFRFMLSLTIYSSGVYTVVVLAGVYAKEVMQFDERQTIIMILIVNVTAAIGAFVFGHIQDRLGSVRTLAVTLLLWVLAIVLVITGTGSTVFWIAANLIGLAMGSCQSAGRALIGLFTPAGRSAEYFGLWGLAVKLSAIIGPLSYGFISYMTAGNHRYAILGTLVFFVAGFLLLLTVNEKRGREIARHDY
jgi:UMF1 family MFS transporter